ncbi:MAG: ATP-binding protein [Candidatus Sabulitectum sp.]|nr:ATP-binding protein [Candidatus Sabulitectum sp.]
MFPRNITGYMEEWFKGVRRKPMLLRGARQTGKTSAVRLFAGKLPGYIELNMEAPREKSVFEQQLPVRDLVKSIRLSRGKTASLEESLLFIDEIQACPSAIGYLRLLYEEVPELAVIASGSLLEVYLLKSGIEFPVGRVTHCYMHPLSFREYLRVFQKEDMLDLLGTIPLPDYAFPAIYREFVKFALSGGMPEIVQAAVDRKESGSVSNLYSSLLTSFLDDVPKYASNRTMAEVIRHCLEVAPAETGSRIKFAGFGNSSYRSREVSEAMKTLQRAMLLSLTYPTGEVIPPPRPNLRKSPKLFYLDSGLLAYSLGAQWSEIGTEDLNSAFNGALAEQCVAQALMKSNVTLQFWARDSRGSSAEVDFVVQHKEKMIPVEVKSGATGRLRSLHRYIEDCPHQYAVRFCGGPVRVDLLCTPAGKEYKLMNLPHFLAGDLHYYLNWLIEN